MQCVQPDEAAKMKRLKRQAEISERGSGSVVILNMLPLRVQLADLDRRKVSAVSNALFEDMADYTVKQLVEEGKLDYIRLIVEEIGFDIKVTDETGATLLHSAVQHNQLAVAEYLIDQNIDINACDNDGNTALHYAAIHQNHGAAKLLLSSPVINDRILNANMESALHTVMRTLNPDMVRTFLEVEKVDTVVRGKRGRTPMHLAAELDFVDGLRVASEVIKQQSTDGMIPKYRVCAADDDGVTPLHYAARCGSSAALDFMLTSAQQHGYPIEGILKFLDEENRTPLHAAVDAGHIGVVEVLMKHGACPCSATGDQLPSAHLAVARGNLAMLQIFVSKYGGCVLSVADKFGSTVLHKAVFSINSEPLVEFLLRKGCNPNQKDGEGSTALHLAASIGNEKAVRLMLAQNGDPLIKNMDDQNVLCCAAFWKKDAVARALFDHCFCKKMIGGWDANGKNALHYAIAGDLDCLVVTMISKAGLKESQDAEGNTVIHAAAKKGNSAMLKSILELEDAHLYINEPNELGSTPLHFAAVAGHKKCCEVLLEHGALVHKCHQGFTPFLSAAYHGNVSVMKQLHEAHPFQKSWSNSKGDTALHLAARNGHTGAVQFCLDIGVSVTHNKEGESFLDIAIASGHEQIVLVAVNHTRWQWCLDLHSPNCDPPMVALIEKLPKAAIAVLDRCLDMAPGDPKSKEYWEVYNFKYLLNPAAIKEEGLDCTGCKQDVNENSGFKAISELFNEQSHQTASGVAARPAKAAPPLHVLRSMLRFHRLQCLTHPVVDMYLKTKWAYYGRLLNLSQLAFYCIYLILFTAFFSIVMTSSAVSTTAVPANGTNVTGASTSPDHSFGLSIAVLVLLFGNSLHWTVCQFGTIQYRCFHLSWHFVVELLGYICSYVFFGLYLSGRQSYELAAFAFSFSWLTLIFHLQFYVLFGIYIFMIVEIFNTLLRVMLVGVLFIVTFGYVLYSLVGTELSYSSIPKGMFTIFAASLGEFEYADFLHISDRLLYPQVTFFFVIFLALLVTISFSNLLIALAVGDIDRVRKTAIFRQRDIKIHYFSGVDPPLHFIWRHCCKSLSITKRRITPHAHRNVLFHLWSKLWSTLKIEEPALVSSGVPGYSEGPTQELQSEIDALQSKVNDLVHLQNEQMRMTRTIYRRLWQQMKLTMPEGESFDSTSFTSSHL